MSAPASPFARPPRARSHRATGSCALGLCLSLVALAALPNPRDCAAQEPDKVSPDDPDRADTRRPVPADSPGAKARERLAVPDRNRAMFSDIEDLKPLARQDLNRGEYDAWAAVVLHAQKQATRELDAAAAQDLVPINLTQTPDQHRCDLVRFDGKLVSARRLAVTAGLLARSGVKELYEVRLVPLDESPLNPVAVVVHELPPALAVAVRDKAPDEWADADGWVTASGFFFKAMSVPVGAGGATAALPLLVGKGLTPLDGPPSGGPVFGPTDRKLVFDAVKDDIKAGRPQPGSAGWFEYAAYNRAVLRAHRFTAEELERDASTDLRFADLFEDVRQNGRNKVHHMALVRFQGRLISLRKMEPNEWLQAGGVKELYEGWMIPENEPRGNPICIVFTEPLPDVEPARRVNKWVTFAGYSFKRLRYESGEDDPKEKGKRLDKLAPMLIGKGPIGRPDPSGGVGLTWSGFVTTVLVSAVLIVGSAAAFTVWYRRGDRQAKAQMDAVRHRNPFAPGGAAAPADGGERP